MLTLGYSEPLDALLGDLFGSNSIRKIGVGLKDDLAHIRKSCDKRFSFFENPNSIDDLVDFNDHSLAEICNAQFGKPLCKKLQVSNWEQRPLTESQVHYAALDAWLSL